MPATHLTKKYSKPKTPPVDPLKGVILERVKALGLGNEDVCKILNCCHNTATRRLKEPTREWKLGDVLKMCRALEIPIEELRNAIRY